ncbi:MAG: flagellar hook-length control protein FliK [Hyphomonadaceae bacterium]
MDVLAPLPVEAAPSPGPAPARADESPGEDFAAHLENETDEAAEQPPPRAVHPHTDASARAAARIAALAGSFTGEHPAAQPQQQPTQQASAASIVSAEQVVTQRADAQTPAPDAVAAQQVQTAAPTPQPQSQQAPQQSAAPMIAVQTPTPAQETPAAQSVAERPAPTSSNAAEQVAAAPPPQAPAAQAAPAKQQAIPAERAQPVQTATPRTNDQVAPEAVVDSETSATPEPAPPPAQPAAQASKPNATLVAEPSLRAGRDALIEAAQQSKPAPSQQNAPQRADAAPAQASALQAAPAPTQAAPPPLDPLASVAAASASLTTEQARTHEREAARGSPSAQVAQQIVRRVENGATRFELRLDPPELGRVDVRLELSRDHRVTALIAADDAGTLAQLTRAAREIEQTLQSAGHALAENGLTFDLTDPRQPEAQVAQHPRGAGAHDAAARGEGEPPALPARRALTLESWRGSRVDLVA